MTFLRPSYRSVSLRTRVTLAFALVMSLVLGSSGLIIYTQFKGYVERRIDQELRQRSATFQGLAVREVKPHRIVALSGERYVQIYDRSGRVIAGSEELASRPLLAPDRIRRSRRDSFLTRRDPAFGQDGLRVRVFALTDGRVAALGDSLAARERELQRLAALLLLSLPGALLLASIAGYRVAGAALKPVERMRARAAQITDTDVTQRLPQPGTGDELERLADTLNDMLGRLHTAIEHERQIVSDASHELRTPISVLRARIDVALRSPGQDVGKLRQVLTDSLGDAERLGRLADDLLMLARHDQGRLALRLQPVDVQEAIESAAAGWPGQDEVTAQMRIEGGALVLADPDRLAQVLENLLSNAKRHGAPPITLYAEPAEPESVCLRVTDAGGGFAPDFIERAFDRFSQGTAPGAGGSGLGLAIARAIVEAHGGRVEAANISTGAQVSVFLPKA